MNTDNVYLVILLVLGIVVLSNLAMFAMVRGSRSIKLDWFKNIRSTFDSSYKNGNSPMEELRRRVEGLESDEEE